MDHFYIVIQCITGFPGSSTGKESACKAETWFNYWVGTFPQRKDRLPTPAFLGFSGGSEVKNPPAMWETWVQPLGWEDLLEKGTATHSSIPAWRIPWTEEPGRLQSMGSQ